MFCQYCGKQISEQAKYCPECGHITDNGIAAEAAASPMAQVSHRKRNIIIAAAAAVAVALAVFGVWKTWFSYPTTPEGVLTAFFEAWQRGDDDAMCRYAARGDEDGREDIIEHLAEHTKLEAFELGEMSWDGRHRRIDVDLVIDGSAVSGNACLTQDDGKWKVDRWY